MARDRLGFPSCRWSSWLSTCPAGLFMQMAAAAHAGFLATGSLGSGAAPPFTFIARRCGAKCSFKSRSVREASLAAASWTKLGKGAADGNGSGAAADAGAAAGCGAAAVGGIAMVTAAIAGVDAATCKLQGGTVRCKTAAVTSPSFTSVHSNSELLEALSFVSCFSLSEFSCPASSSSPASL